MNILVVDDMVDVRETTVETVAAALENLDIGVGEIYQAEDGMAALKILETKKPDLILSDYQMPRMDGFELLQAVRKKSSDVPVLITTGAVVNEPFMRLIKALGADVVSKPYDIDTLEKKIAKALAGSPAASPRTTPVSMAPTAAAAMRLFPKDRLVTRDSPRNS